MLSPQLALLKNGPKSFTPLKIDFDIGVCMCVYSVQEIRTKMGRANIFIRKNNEKSWSELPDKSAWVNMKLAEDFGVVPRIKKQSGLHLPLEKPELTSKDFCEHFAGRGFCKHKKCPNSMFNPKNRGA